MNKFRSLVLIQLKDKLDFSWAKSKKDLIRKIVFMVLQFVLVTGVVAGILFIFVSLGLIHTSMSVDLYIIFLTIMLILNVISITFGLMKSLYYAEDNKVLATLPVNSNGLFYSKLVVYFLFQLKKDLGILIPVTLGFVIFLVSKNVINIGAAFWCIIPLFFLSIIILLVSALLSVPVLYIYRFIKQYPLMELILLLALMAAGVVVIILLINLIPQDIDLVNQWPAMRNDLKEAMANFSHHNVVVTFVVRTMFGYQTMSDVYRFALIGRSFINLAILIGVASAIGAVVYFAIKPLYFSMMTKSFEFDKNLIDQPKKNVKHKKYVTFANKELKISFRDIEISGTYLVVYIATPILLFFMDKVFI